MALLVNSVLLSLTAIFGLPRSTISRSSSSSERNRTRSCPSVEKRERPET
jgi:hypothetical protein